MQTIMLIRSAPENEVRYVIGVIQQYNGVILDRPTNHDRSNASEYTTTRTEELQK